MALRRLSELAIIFKTEQDQDLTLFSSWIAVLISLLMFIASFYIRRIFSLQDRINKLRKENEAKVLSAIINTEESDRQFFAKELHDGLGPVLSSVKMAVSAIDKLVVGNMNEKIIEKIEDAIDNAIRTVKEISNNLSPHILERFGIEKAVKTFTDAIITKGELEIIILSNLNGKRFNYNIEVVLYRIICELLSNTLKHAFASRVEITLLNNGNKLEMFYSDNGIGFDFQEEESKGMGLSNINSRVKSFDGKIEIHSKLKHGFFLKIILPI